MKEVKCPKCDSVFDMDASGYADIVSQVRGDEFEKELNNRLKDMEANHNMKLELAEQSIASEKDKQISNLQNQIENHAKEIEIATKDALAEAREELFAKEKQVERLKNEKEAVETNTELLVTKATSELEKDILGLKGKLDIAETQKELEIKQLEQTNLVEMKAKEEIIRFKEDEIERVKDMKMKMSVKDIGEKLEQWCENQFNLVRATAFPHAYFEKDNESVKDEENGKATKGDYMFRDSDANGTEYISIMFEMKDKMEGTKGQTNESHLAKLDKDRKKKKCEYAVLVSMLEPENELYNAGPVDMSHKYEKMYVVRPQEFMLILSLIRNEARKSLEMRNELAVIRSQNIDYETFEDKKLLENYQSAISQTKESKFAEMQSVFSTFYRSNPEDFLHLAQERLGKAESEEVDLSDILEFGNHFSRLHLRILGLENPDVVPILLKQLEAQIELMLLNTKKQRDIPERDIPPLFSEQFEASESEEKRKNPQGELDLESQFKRNARIREKIEKFLGDRPRNTGEILEHINSTMRHGVTVERLDRTLSQDENIVKVGYIKRSGILSGGYDICEWATRNWVSSNCPGWQEGTPITIDVDGNVITDASTD